MTRPASIGVDIGGTKLLLVCGQESRRARTGPDAGPDDIEREVRRFLDDGRIEPAALGVAVPGLLDAEGRVLACDVLPGLVGWRPADAFGDLGCPVHALNDAEAALVEEAHALPAGATAGIVMAGTAIGAAFQIAGEPLRGASGWAGELGYLVIAVDGEVRRLDELAGGASMAARAGVTGEELLLLAHEADPRARAVIREGGVALGLALASLVNLLNPHLLSLGGGALALPGYREAALDAARRYSLPESYSACTVRPVRAGERVVALGAARAALSRS